MRHSMFVIAAGLIIGCGSSGSGSPEIDAGVPADASMASAKANVRFKGNDRLRADIARALSIGSGKVCNELGKYSCTHEVHRVPLLGTAAYDLGLYKPLEQTPLTAPIAVDRLGLAACTQRVDRDLADPASAIIYGGLDISEGALLDVDAPAVSDAIATLYQRMVQRDPTSDEVAVHRDLYREVERIGSTGVARDWAVLSCFTVLTSVEFLFY